MKTNILQRARFPPLTDGRNVRCIVLPLLYYLYSIIYIILSI